jgi:GST-like protein
VAVNPNSKIPALVDKVGIDGKSVNLFESASIVIYFAEKYGKFISSDPLLRYETLNWIFWQMAGQGPMTGNFGHFMVYAPADKIETRDYGVARYGMETQRLLSVLDNHLNGREYMVGEEYSIADIVIFPWFQHLRVGYKHPSGVAAKDFLSVDSYSHANRWADKILARPAVQRGLTVCSNAGAKPWLAV